MRPGEKSILWFSKNRDYEGSAIKPVIIPPNTELFIDLKFLVHHVGVYRFSLNITPEFHQWPELGTLANFPTKDFAALEETGRLVGATPSDWVGTFNTVQLEQLSFQYLHPKFGWVNADIQQAISKLPTNILSRKMT